MLILPYVADGDTFIFADDDILIISWGSVVAVNKINNVYVFYNKRSGGGGGAISLSRAKKTSTKNPRRFLLGDRRIRQLSRICQNLRSP